MKIQSAFIVCDEFCELPALPPGWVMAAEWPGQLLNAVERVAVTFSNG